jgi:GNAT superfamily N-acetyltransferase
MEAHYSLGLWPEGGYSIKVVWDLAKPIPEMRGNSDVEVRPIGRDRLGEMGNILVQTWGGFIKDPNTTKNYVGPYVDAGLEQPYIAYLDDFPVGCVSPRLDLETKSGVLNGGVHVLPMYRRRRIGTTLLLCALRWLREKGMKSAWVTPNNPEGVDATKRAEAFYMASGGSVG